MRNRKIHRTLDLIKDKIEIYISGSISCKCENIKAGEKLASLLNRLIDGLVTEDRSRADIIEDMGRAAGISSGTVNQILNNEINCPPLSRLEGFAEALDVSVSRLRTTAETDGCDYGEEDDD